MEIEDIKNIHLEKGDVLWVKLSEEHRQLPADKQKSIKALIKQIFPDNKTVISFGDDITFSKISIADIE